MPGTSLCGEPTDAPPFGPLVGGWSWPPWPYWDSVAANALSALLLRYVTTMTAAVTVRINVKMHVATPPDTMAFRSFPTGLYVRLDMPWIEPPFLYITSSVYTKSPWMSSESAGKRPH